MLQEKSAKRKRVNFMIQMQILQELESLIPNGDRSAFVNEAIECKLVDWGRAKTFEEMEKSIKKQKKVHTTKEILKLIHEGRRY